MAAKKLLQQLGLTDKRQLQTLVENRRIYNLKTCELNIFETYRESYKVPLTFSDFVITSMVKGKKVMHLDGKPSFEYLPGETVIVPPNDTMVIDFPEASEKNATQCIALAVDNAYINKTIAFLNEQYNTVKDDANDWKLQFNHYHFDNEADVAMLIDKLIKICIATDTAKDIYTDLTLKELLVRLMQSQHLCRIQTEHSEAANYSRLHFVLNYIHQNLAEKIEIDVLSRKAYLNRNTFFRSFKEQFGLTPLEYINKERIRMAKQLLAVEHNSVKNVSQQCGFTDVNYFVRLFRKKEGITPGEYQLACATAFAGR